MWTIAARLILSIVFCVCWWPTTLLAQPAPTTKVITLGWTCVDTCPQATLFTAYKQIDCVGSLVAASTTPGPATSMQVSSSLLRNTCWYVTAQTSPADESPVSNGISFPIALLGGFPVRLSWNAPVGGVPVVQYRVAKQVGCAGNYVTAGLVNLPVSTLIPFGQIQVVSVDSQELIGGNYPATNAIDGNTATIWHTEYSQVSPPQPHTLVLNLGTSYQVDRFRYLPRQDGGINGTIAGYEFYVSTDGVTWGSAVATSVFAANTLEKLVNFQAKIGQYVKLISVSEINGLPFTSVAEVGVFGISTLINTPLTFVVDPPVSAADCWQVTALADDNSESPGSTPFQIPSTILGGGIHHIFGKN